MVASWLCVDFKSSSMGSTLARDSTNFSLVKIPCINFQKFPWVVYIQCPEFWFNGLLFLEAIQHLDSLETWLQILVPFFPRFRIFG